MAGSLRIFAKKKTCNVNSVKEFTHVTLKDFKKFKKKIEIILFKIKQLIVEMAQ